MHSKNTLVIDDSNVPITNKCKNNIKRISSLAFCEETKCVLVLV